MFHFKNLLIFVFLINYSLVLVSAFKLVEIISQVFNVFRVPGKPSFPQLIHDCYYIFCKIYVLVKINF